VLEVLPKAQSVQRYAEKWKQPPTAATLLVESMGSDSTVVLVAIPLKVAATAIISDKQPLTSAFCSAVS